MGFKLKHPKDLSAISQIDWARLAAYIDGEGCISIKGVRGFNADSRRVLYVDIAVANTDFRLGEWLQKTFGGSIYVVKRKHISERWSPCAKWNVASRYACAILEGCLPYFIIKREQADVALAFQRTILPGRPYGMKGRPAELIATQVAFKERLESLKGTSSRKRKTEQGSTIQ